MAYSYPIWNQIDACIYKSSKSYGAKNDNSFKQYVGSSSANSHLHVKFSTTRRLKEEFKGYKDIWVFRTSLDDVVLKETLFENNNGRPGKLIKQISKLNKIKSL